MLLFCYLFLVFYAMTTYAGLVSLIKDGFNINDGGQFICLLIVILGSPFAFLCYSLIYEHWNKNKNKNKNKNDINDTIKFNSSITIARVNSLTEAYNCTPEEFEELVKSIFEKLSYRVVRTPYQNDGGVDLILYKDEKTELVECKRYKGSVSVNIVREFYGVMIGQQVTKGYIVTTGHFTLSARKFAEGKGIHLIDGDELSDILVNQEEENSRDPDES